MNIEGKLLLQKCLTKVLEKIDLASRIHHLQITDIWGFMFYLTKYLKLVHCLLIIVPFWTS